MGLRTPKRSSAIAGYLALGHCITDIYPAFVAPLLPLLIDKFQISFTSASLLVTVMTFSASLTQPFFGFLFDRIDGRKMLVFGPLVGGLSLSLIGLAPHYSILLLLLILGGLGVSAYHPEAAALTSSLSGDRRTWGMSIFMLGGNLGYGLGPFFILSIVTILGLEWSFVSCLPVIGLAFLLHRQSVHFPSVSRTSSPPSTGAGLFSDGHVFRFCLLLLIVLFRVTTALSLITFFPVVQKLRGFSLIIAGSSNTIFIAFGALGGVIGGYMADRSGRKKIILLSFLLAIPALLAFLYWKGPVSFLILPVLGFLLFLSEPSCIVLAQEMVPNQARTVSGLVMGMAWGLAGLGVLATGALADAVGIEWALRFLLLLPAGGFLLSLFLPQDIA